MDKPIADTQPIQPSEDAPLEEWRSWALFLNKRVAILLKREGEMRGTITKLRRAITDKDEALRNQKKQINALYKKIDALTESPVYRLFIRVKSIFKAKKKKKTTATLE